MEHLLSHVLLMEYVRTSGPVSDTALLLSPHSNEVMHNWQSIVNVTQYEEIRRYTEE